MTDWSYLYLAVPPVLALAYALLAQRSVAKSGKEIDALKAEQRERQAEASPLSVLASGQFAAAPPSTMYRGRSTLRDLVESVSRPSKVDPSRVEQALQHGSQETGAFRTSILTPEASRDTPKATG